MNLPISDVTFKEREHDIRQMFNERYDFAYRNWEPFLAEAQVDLAYFLGDQWSAKEKQQLKEEKRNALVINKIRPKIKMVTGYERRTRMSIITEPVGDEDQAIADQINQALLLVQQKDKTYQTKSDAFESMLKTGLNFVDLRLDYSEDDVYGDIVSERIPYNGVLIDPRTTRRDLSDCEFILRRKLVGRDTAKSLVPWASDEIDDIPHENLDNKFPLMAQFGDSRNQDVMKYDEMWSRSFKPVRQIVDKVSGTRWTREVFESQFGLVGEQVDQVVEMSGQLQWMTRQEPTVDLNIMINGVSVFSGEEPWGLEDFSMTPIFGFWDPEFSGISSGDDFGLKLQSLVRCQRDPQTELNRRRNKAIDILNTALNNGFIAKSAAVTNKRSLYQTGQGKVIFLDDDAQPGDVVPLPAANVPQGDILAGDLFDKDIAEIAGISEELLGEITSRGPIAADTVRARQAAGLTLLQDLFDNYNTAQRIIGEKMLKMMVKNWVLPRGDTISPKLERILNEPALPAWRDGTILKYDLNIEEANETASQKNLFWQQLLQARSVGIDIPSSVLLEAMPIQNKDKIIEAVQQAEQLQQQQAQIEAEQRQTLNQLSQAKVVADLSLAAERQGRMAADIGLARERISEMQQNHAQANLDRVRAVKEIEGMETDRLLKMLAFMREIEQRQNASAELAVEQDRNEASQTVQLQRQAIEQQSAGQAQQQPQNQPII